MLGAVAQHWKGIVQVAFPTLVVLDTAHSVWRLRRVAQAQIQASEWNMAWEQEEQRDLVADVVPRFHEVVRRCRAQEDEQWPRVPGVGVVLPGEPQLAENAVQPGPARAGLPPPHVNAVASLASGRHERRQQQQPSMIAESPQPSSHGSAERCPGPVDYVTLEDVASDAAALLGLGRARNVEYVTLEDAVGDTFARLRPHHPPNIVYVTLADAAAVATGADADSPLLLRVARRLSRRALDRGVKSLETAVEAVREALPWVRVEATRRSALRWQLAWRGPPDAVPESLERDLSAIA